MPFALNFAVAGSLDQFVALINDLVAHEKRPSLLILPSEKDVQALRRALAPLGIEMWVPDDIHQEVERLRALRLDLLVCSGFPQILKTPILELPRLGCVNLHTSRLPDYRGRHPVNWALILGEREIGITLHFMNERIDDGDIILQDTVPVGRDDDINDVQRRLIPIGCRMVNAGLDQIAAGTVYRRHQLRQLSRYLPKRRPDDGRVNFEQSGREINRLVNALVDPLPNAFAIDGDERVHLKRAHLGHEVGEVLAETRDGRYVIAVQDGVILVSTDRRLSVGSILT